MLYLVDTNVLARSLDAAHPDCVVAKAAIRRLKSQGDLLTIVPQILYEWWVVVTRPLSSNGLGLSAPVAEAALARLEAKFPMLPDGPLLFDAWRTLVRRHVVLGKQAHDARLAAAMQIHGLTHLLTFNAKDFVRYPFVTVHTPADILAAP